MFTRFLRTIAVAALLAAGMRVAALAQTAPSAVTPIPIAPAPVSGCNPTPAPNAKLSQDISGTLRAYDFDRLNETQNKSNPNRSAFNTGGDLCAQYRIAKTPITLAAAYYGAYPFGVNGPNPGFNNGIDNTLPGFSLSTLGILNLHYQDPTANIVIGDQNLNLPWAPAADTRIKPILYQGADATINITPTIALGLTRIDAFESRTASTFSQTTYITSAPPGGTAFPLHYTPGFFRAALTFKPTKQLTINTEDYEYYNIANLAYLEARYSTAGLSPLAPFFAVQGLSEVNSGQSVVGKIDNQTWGAQIGFYPVKTVQFALGFDESPWNYAITTSKTGAGYWLPTGGTSSIASIGGNLYRVAYGGLASPYTYGLAADPLYDTAFTQGSVDRASAGQGYRAQLIYDSPTRFFQALVGDATYNYGNLIGPNRTSEFYTTWTFYLHRQPTSGRYRGLSIRERYGDRSQPTLPYSFKYIRSQLEYDF